MGATLDTGGWLTLARPGLSPGKMHQASLGASVFGEKPLTFMSLVILSRNAVMIYLAAWLLMNRQGIYNKNG